MVDGDGFEPEMVLLRGANPAIPVPHAERGPHRHHGRQGGILPPAGCQLYPGYGTAAPSVSVAFN